MKKKLECVALERCCGPYRNPWFLVPKKSRVYHLINTAQRLNTVTIKDASLPPSADEFSEEFAGFPLLSLLDLFSGYDQWELNLSTWDMTGFQTPLGLLRMTALPQGYMNEIQVFDWVMKKILKDQIATGRGKPFIDDVAVKPASCSMFLDENGVPEEVALGIRKFVLKAIISVDRVLADIDRAGEMILGAKSEFLIEKLKVMVYICGSDERTPENTKVQRIMNWLACQAMTEIKAFIGLCVYYRV